MCVLLPIHFHLLFLLTENEGAGLFPTYNLDDVVTSDITRLELAFGRQGRISNFDHTADPARSERKSGLPQLRGSTNAKHKGTSLCDAHRLHIGRVDDSLLPFTSSRKSFQVNCPCRGDRRAGGDPLLEKSKGFLRLSPAHVGGQEQSVIFLDGCPHFIQLRQIGLLDLQKTDHIATLNGAGRLLVRPQLTRVDRDHIRNRANRSHPKSAFVDFLPIAKRFERSAFSEKLTFENLTIKFLRTLRQRLLSIKSFISQFSRVLVSLIPGFGRDEVCGDPILYLG